MPNATATIWDLTKGHRLRYGTALGSLVAAVALGYLVPLVPQAVLDGVLVDGGTRASAFTRRMIDAMGGTEFLQTRLWIPGLVMVAIAAVTGICTHVRTRLAASASEAVAKGLRDRLYDHIQRLPCPTLDKRESGDLLQRCTSDVETVRAFFASQVVEIGRALLMLIVPIPFIILLDWRMAIASVAIVPIIIGFSLVFFRRMRPLFLAKEAAEGKMTSTITENLTGIRVVRAFARQEFEKSKFASTSGAFRDEDMRLFRLFATFWATSDLLCFLQQIIVVATGLWLLTQGSLLVGEYFYCITAVTMFIWPVRMMGRILADLGKALVAIERAREILDTPDEHVGEPTEPASVMAHAKNLGGAEIVFQNVVFGFSKLEGTPPVLNGVSFRVPAGATLGLVGPSGAGKSTVAQLLLRLYDYTSGSITVDGRELRTIPRREIRGMIGTVMQQPFLYSKTLRENILISAAGHLNDEDAMCSAASIASVHESIEEFPQRYETQIGERGITLSGGQRQRVAIARSLVQDPRILLLDDALSAVDTHTESQILAGFHSREARHTTIIVAHRLSTLRHADIIVVLDRGRVIQQGTHDTLIAVPGMYRALWEIQTNLDDLDEPVAIGSVS
ncbi:MAG: ABC transporter ATP-binding protein [Phycisphaerae bacterium]|nr:ABC transporter ATP-binding protein [Phycisphaerae bacterium]